MPTRTFKITLESDLVASLRPGSGIGHECLDYLPGSLLRGLLASEWGNDGFAQAMFGGGLKCFDAYPAAPSGEPCVPVPFSFHAGKETVDMGNGRKLFKWRNYANVQPGEDERQRRRGYLPGNAGVDESSDLIVPNQVERGKTAIDPSLRNQAMESQLFAYRALAEGQVFLATLEGDQELLDKASAILLREGNRLGRSRSAEFGLVSIEESTACQSPLLDETDGNAGQVTLLLLSDLRILRNGNPTFEPFVTDFGLDPTSARIIWDKTFLRTRSYSPWNAYIDSYEDERHLITKGSVITLQLDNSEDLSSLRKTLQQGIGLNREEGFGQIALNPKILSTGSLFIDESPDEKKKEKTEVQSNHPLYTYVKLKAQKNDLRMKAEKHARVWQERLVRVANAIHQETGKTVTPSQWEGLRAIVVESGFEPEAFKKKLTEYATNSLRKHIWSKAEVPMSGYNGRISLKDFILGENCGEDPKLRPHVVYQAAQLASRKLRQSNN